MKLKNNTLFLICLLGILSCKNKNQITTISHKKEIITQTSKDSSILSHIVNPKKSSLKFYLKNNQNNNYKTLKNLKSQLDKENTTLVFATNGGMFKKDFSPQGLYIENGKVITKLDTITKGFGNFYLQPNGVFFITKDDVPVITTTKKFKTNRDINYVTQSGPMLVINDSIHPKFNKGSSNLNIRNGVGILPNGNLLFAMSKGKINFYDFATFFKNKGCKNALYLDGFVSKTYLPEQNWKQLNGAFGVIIAQTKPTNTN